jgi:P27 family predicted phage terminase small subunit
MRAPAHLDEQAKAKWRELADQVDVSQPGNADALAAYCMAYSQWKTAQAQVEQLGTVVRSPAGFPAISPYVTVAAQAERRMRQWGKELGIVSRTAKAKGKATTSPEAPDPEEPQVDALDAAVMLARLADAPAPPPRRRRRAP